MHFSTFDQYVARQSLIHELDPRLKIVLTILFIVSNVFLPDGSWWAFGVAWLAVMGVTTLARVPWSYILKRSLIAVPFTLAAVTVIFTLPGETVGSFQLGSWTFTATDAGLLRFGSIFVRGWLSVQMAFLLTATTQFPDILHGLRHLRVPSILVSIISFMYRYLFVLADEAGRLIRGRAARSASMQGQKSGRSITWRAKVAGSMIGQLFIRSMERSDRVYNAMLARGYSGEMLTMNPHKMMGQDWAIGGLFLILLALIQAIAYL